MIKLTKGLSTRPLVDSFYATACTFIHSWPSDFRQFFVASSDCYPGYQRFFSRAAGIFGVWPKADTSSAVGRSHERRSRVTIKRAGHYKDLTETGNRARNVSGTQGIRLLVRLLEFCDLRSKHNKLGKNDVAQSENS